MNLGFAALAGVLALVVIHNGPSLGNFFLHCVQRLTDMVFCMRGRKEETQAVCSFFNSREGNGHHIDAALEQRIGQKARNHGVAHHDGNHRIALGCAGIKADAGGVLDKELRNFLQLVYAFGLAQHDFKLPPLLTDTEIEVILGKVDELVSWASDIKEYALQQALSGKEWTGFKLVEGRSNRKYTDETAVMEAVKRIGLDPYEHKILGVTAMAALLGKKRFEEMVGGFVEKPQGKPVLVPVTDKRMEIDTTTAADDFADPIEN